MEGGDIGDMGYLGTAISAGSGSTEPDILARALHFLPQMHLLDLASSTAALAAIS